MIRTGKYYFIRINISLSLNPLLPLKLFMNVQCFIFIKK